MAKLKSLEKLFERRRFDREVIILCVRWYLRFKLSLRAVVEIIVERSLSLARTTFMPWAQHFTPEPEKRWRQFGLPVGCRGGDETNVKTRAMVDLILGRRRAITAANPFFRNAIKCQGRAPQTIALDRYLASDRAMRKRKAQGSSPNRTSLRSSKYLNNLTDQDHWRVGQRAGAMLGFKWFRSAAIAIARTVVTHVIPGRLFALGRLDVRGRVALAVWSAALKTEVSRCSKSGSGPLSPFPTELSRRRELSVPWG